MKSIVNIFKSFFGNLNQNSVEGVKLEKGEKIELKIPEAILGNGIWRISEWYVENGDNISPGKVLCKIESENEESNFESFLEGKINYRNTSKNRLDKDSIIAEIVG
ncbi:hypothetical protein [Algibacter mikhailovii]|uniref:hypothetical protein n=1 Tax=Algibacter mikhailovii TaxID=425498 RepID=UPI0024955595|nr:hypothetical protein [Algibacter mikhailovii]